MDGNPVTDLIDTIFRKAQFFQERTGNLGGALPVFFPGRPETVFAKRLVIGNIMQETGNDHISFIKAFLCGDFPADVCHTVGMLNPIRQIFLLKFRCVVKFLFQEFFRFPDPFMIQHCAPPKAASGPLPGEL